MKELREELKRQFEECAVAWYEVYPEHDIDHPVPDEHSDSYYYAIADTAIALILGSSLHADPNDK